MAPTVRRRGRVVALAVALVTAAVFVPHPAVGAPAGAVLAFGSAPDLGGSAANTVALAATPSGRGYWLAAANGRVATVGDATSYGSVGTHTAPIVALAPTPTGRGYWLASSDGGVFAFGNAGFLGSLGRLRLNAPIVAMAATPSGRGYWLTATDGGIFTFGDARFLGSTGAVPLNRPIVGMAPTPTGGGYWLVASDGGIFSFGDARFHGSLGQRRLVAPIVAMTPTSSGDGYRLAAADGGVFTFGDADFDGSAAGRLPAGHRVVALAAHPSGEGYWLASSLVTKQVTIAAAGDVHGEGRVQKLLDAGGNPFDAIAPTLAAADVAMVNLETAVGTSGQAAVKEHTFRAPLSLLAALKSAGVDVVNLANNHALDYGTDALLDTIDRARAAGLLTVGAGRDRAEAYAPVVVRTPGGAVAVVGLSRVLPAGWAAGLGRPGLASAYDQSAAVAAVRRAAQLAPTVVVMIHWGVELAACPDAAQRGLADALVAAGADVVAGHHPHVLEGFDQRPGAVVAYSLGNFVWYHSNPPTNTTAVLTATSVEGRVVASDMVPARIDGTGRPRLLAGDDAARVRSEVASLAPGRGRC
ncbi:MAG: putative enzyme of poly-gamma-glutamate biosynthesis (capsule formation)-like protein [Acidimicrobiales bacterium]|nr:putative enzyme of poly-gamma-glutamate biosynthesis (capsule formation)-like protein [Acidimicrobiales bacterium]